MEIEDEYYDDDPVNLFDCKDFHDEHNVDSGSNFLHRDLKYKLSLKSCYMLPLSFFKIPSNLEKLRQCLPLRVKLVDYYKHPWYFKKQRVDMTSKYYSDDDDDDDDNDIIDLTLEPIKNDEENKVNAAEKKWQLLNEKCNRELIKALCQKNPENVDYKRNKGLVGLTITRRVIVNDSLLDYDCDQEGMKQVLVPKKKHDVTVTDISKYGKEEIIAKVVDTKNKCLNDDMHETKECHKQKESVSKGKSMNNNVAFDTKCSLKNVSVELLNKILSLKKAKALKSIEEKDRSKKKNITNTTTDSVNSPMQMLAQCSSSMNEIDTAGQLEKESARIFSGNLVKTSKMLETNLNLHEKDSIDLLNKANISNNLPYIQKSMSQYENIANSNNGIQHNLENSVVLQNEGGSDIELVNKSKDNRSSYESISKSGVILTHTSMLQHKPINAILSSTNIPMISSSRNDRQSNPRSTLQEDECANLIFAEMINNLNHQRKDTPINSVTHLKRSSAHSPIYINGCIPNNAKSDSENICNRTKNLSFSKKSKIIRHKKIENEFVNKTKHIESAIKHIAEYKKNNLRGKCEERSKEEEMSNAYRFTDLIKKSGKQNINSSSTVALCKKVQMIPDKISSRDLYFNNKIKTMESGIADTGNVNIGLKLSNYSIPSHDNTSNANFSLVDKTIDSRSSVPEKATGDMNQHIMDKQNCHVSNKSSLQIPEVESPERKSPILHSTILPKKTVNCHNRINRGYDFNDLVIDKSTTTKKVDDNELKGDTNMNVMLAPYDLKHDDTLSRECKLTAATNYGTETLNNTVLKTAIKQKAVQHSVNYTEYTNNPNSIYSTMNCNKLLTTTNPELVYQGNNVSARQMNQSTHLGNSNTYKIPVINTQASQIIIKPQNHSQFNTYPLHFAPLPQYAPDNNSILRNMLGHTEQRSLYQPYDPNNPNVYHMYPQYHTHYRTQPHSHPQVIANLAPHASNKEEMFFNQKNTGPNSYLHVGPNPKSSIIGRNTGGVIKKINIPPSVICRTNPDKGPTMKPPSQSIKHVINNLKRDIIAPTQNDTNSNQLVNTKDEMIKELDKIVIQFNQIKDLKRSYCNDKTNACPKQTNASGSESEPNEKKRKSNAVEPKQTQRHVTTIKAHEKGYSPPILPIPTYQNVLSKVNHDTHKDIETTIKTFCNKLDSFQNTNYSLIEKITNLGKDTSNFRKSMKKISIEDYKRRIGNLQNDNNMLIPKNEEYIDAQEMERYVEYGERHLVRAENYEDLPNVDNAFKISQQKDITDLGYVSDTQGKRTS